MKGIGIKFDKVKSLDVKSVGLIKSDADLVAEAIHRILNTKPFERPRERIGCRIREAVFEPNDYITATLGGFFVSDSISKFESRVEILQILSKPIANSNTLSITVVFRMKSDPSQTFSTTTVTL